MRFPDHLRATPFEHVIPASLTSLVSDAFGQTDHSGLFEGK